MTEPINNFLRNLFFCLLLTGWSTLLFAQTDQISSKRQTIQLTGNWQYICGNLSVDEAVRNSDSGTISWEFINSPKDFSKPCKTDLWFRTTIPDWEGTDPALFIRIMKDMAEVYLDSQKIYSTGNFLPGSKITFNGLTWHLIELPKDFKGKVLTIRLRSRHLHPGINDTILLGSHRTMLSGIVRKSMGTMFLALLYLCSAVISLFLLFLIKEFSDYKGFIILQVALGVSTFVNLPVIQLMVHTPKTIYYIDHISMFATTFGFVLLIETVLASRYRIIFRVIRYCLSVAIPITIIIDFTLFPFHRYIAVPFYILLTGLIFAFVFFSIKSYRLVSRTSKLFILGLNSYALFAFIEIGRYYWRIFEGTGSIDIKYLHWGGFCLFFFLTWILVSHYVNMNKQIITTKERERERIARDLHDEIGPRLTEIKIVSEMVRQENLPVESINEKLDDLSFATENVLSSFREIIWALSPANSSLEELATYLGQCASEFLEKAAVRCRLELLPEFPAVEVPYDFRRNIIMAVKEALNNVVKHADASLVKVSMTTKDRSFIIEIEDNGKGFDTGTVHRYGNGLKNIHCRIESFGGKANIDSIINSGTKVILKVPFEEIKYSPNVLL